MSNYDIYRVRGTKPGEKIHFTKVNLETNTETKLDIKSVLLKVTGAKVVKFEDEKTKKVSYAFRMYADVNGRSKIVNFGGGAAARDVANRIVAIDDYSEGVKIEFSLWDKPVIDKATGEKTGDTFGTVLMKLNGEKMMWKYDFEEQKKLVVTKVVDLGDGETEKRTNANKFWEAIEKDLKGIKFPAYNGEAQEGFGDDEETSTPVESVANNLDEIPF